MPVLLTGETGTGKEVMRAAHPRLVRARRPPLRPHQLRRDPERADGGRAVRLRPRRVLRRVPAYDGRLVAAEGGTVFLDEIDDTPRDAPDQAAARARGPRRQPARRERVARGRLPDHRRDQPRSRPLIEAGLFGADLYERLAIVSISAPPAARPAGGSPDLVAHFLARFYRESPTGPARPGAKVSPRALEALGSYSWPGNVRELRNVLYQALVYKRSGEELLLSDLPRRVSGGAAGTGLAESGLVDRAAIARRIEAGTMNLRQLRDEVERPRSKRRSHERRKPRGRRAFWAKWGEAFFGSRGNGARDVETAPFGE